MMLHNKKWKIQKSDSIDLSVNLHPVDVSFRSNLSSSPEFFRTDSIPFSHPALFEYHSEARIICPFPAFNLNLCSPALSVYISNFHIIVKVKL